MWQGTEPGKDRALVLAFCAGVLALAACGSRAKSQPPSPEASTSASATPASAPTFPESEWSELCTNAEAYGKKCNSGLTGANVDECRQARACTSAVMNAPALRALSQCMKRAACDADCASQVEKTLTPSPATAFMDGCAKMPKECALDCESMRDSMHLTMLSADLVDPLTKCFTNNPACADANMCLMQKTGPLITGLGTCPGLPLGGGGQTAAADEPAPVAAAAVVGRPLPAFSGSTLDKHKPFTSASLAGKVVVVHFWAGWCGPCKISMPGLQKLADKYGSKGLVVVGVSTDDDEASAVSFLKSQKTKFPTMFDADKTISNSFTVKTMPSTWIVDRKGVVRFEHPGFMADGIAVYEKEIKSLL